MIARERTSILVLREPGELLMIELRDPTTAKRFFSLPGGQVEPGETPAACAIRETREETGYDVRLVGEPVTSDYLFRWNARIYDCHCHWFLATPSGEPVTVDDADYLLGQRWLPVRDALRLLVYHPHVQQTATNLVAAAPGNLHDHV